MPIRNRSKTVRARRELEVLNRLGLHARPAAEFVRHVQSFRSDLMLVTGDGRRFHAGRIIDVLLADLDCGAKFIVEAEGPDAEAAIERIERLLVELRDFEESQQSRPPAERDDADRM